MSVIKNVTVSNNKIMIRIIIYNVLTILYNINTIIGSETDLKNCE